MDRLLLLMLLLMLMLSLLYAAEEDGSTCAYDHPWSHLDERQVQAAQLLGMTHEDFESETSAANSTLALSPELVEPESRLADAVHPTETLQRDFWPSGEVSEPHESDTSRDTVTWEESGAHPSLPVEEPPGALPEGVPSSSSQIALECTRWAVTSGHARYVIRVTAPGRAPYEVNKRWSEISDISSNLYRYDSFLPRKFQWQDNKERPLPTKWTSAGNDGKRLTGRQADINSFLKDLSGWMNRLLENYSINLLDQNEQGKQIDMISQFFAADA